jgi:1,4-dihydroxy-2-naphthoate octaprenyltransferase
MNQPNPPSTIALLLPYARPWSLLAGILSYALGSGIARYLGHNLDPLRFWAGLLLVLILLLAGYTLKLYYDLIETNSPLRRIQKGVETEDPDQILARRLPRQPVLLAAFTLLTTCAVLTFLLVAQGALQLPGLLILGGVFFLAFFYGVPPLCLAHIGYGEFSEAVLITALFPALAFILQTGDLHRLLLMTSFPLLILFLAMNLAQSLEFYARDQRLAHRTMMIVLGWQRGMQLHNILILLGYLMLGVAAAFGLPWGLTWPALLTLPVGLFQIDQINQMIAGAKPNWRLLQLTSMATFALTAYLLVFSIWMG